MLKIIFRNKRKKHILLKLDVDGTGDLICDRKSMVDLGGQQYMAATKVSSYIIERDFRREDDRL